MKQLNKTQTIVFILGGILMTLGAGCYAFIWQQHIAGWLFLTGAVAFGIMQIMQSYQGSDITLRRLRKLQITADILFILCGLLMVDSAYKLSLPLFLSYGADGYYTYLTYVYNKWALVLLVAALLEIYTVHRISRELDKTKNT